MKKGLQCNIKLSAEEAAILEKCSAITGLSKSRVLRLVFKEKAASWLQDHANTVQRLATITPGFSQPTK